MFVSQLLCIFVVVNELSLLRTCIRITSYPVFYQSDCAVSNLETEATFLNKTKCYAQLKYALFTHSREISLTADEEIETSVRCMYSNPSLRSVGSCHAWIFQLTSAN